MESNEIVIVSCAINNKNHDIWESSRINSYVVQYKGYFIKTDI